MKEMVGGCCVCSDERGWAENPLVYCDGQGCNVAVHQACYGIVQVPTGPWFCRKCESQERAARVRCELCPSKDGALKRTDNTGWAHVVCALYVPEVRFGNVTTMEPIILQLVPQERFNRSCYICEDQGKESKATVGACMQCNKNGCKQYFHVTCAQAAGLLCEEAGNYMDNVKYCGYCHYHYQKLKKDGNIKPIPAFKPIPADNATPEPSPEKSSSPPRSTADRGRGGRRPSDDKRRSGGGDGEGREESESKCERTGKFTTANFTETVIAPGGSPVFAAASAGGGNGRNGSGNNKKKRSSISSSLASSPSSSSNSSSMPMSLSSPVREEDQSVDAGKRRRSRSLLPGRVAGGQTPIQTVTLDDETKVEGDQELPSKKKRHCSTASGAPSPGSSALPAASETDHTYHRAAAANGLQNGFASPSSSVAFHQETSALQSLVTDGAIQDASTILPPRPFSRAGIRLPFADHFMPPPSPQTLEQLLERQWEQGSQFLMEQAQHFDSKADRLTSGPLTDSDDPSPPTVASLLSCLHQLRSENRKLESHVGGLVARRDHLLAVNARLALPLGSYQLPPPSSTAGTGGEEASPADRRFYHTENGVSPQGSSYVCSPMQGHSPNANGLATSPESVGYLPLDTQVYASLQQQQVGGRTSRGPDHLAPLQHPQPHLFFPAPGSGRGSCAEPPQCHGRREVTERTSITPLF